MKKTTALLPLLSPATDSPSGAAVAICPGGGYAGPAINHEGHPILRHAP